MVNVSDEGMCLEPYSYRPSHNVQIGDAECQQLARGLQRLPALQRLEIKADTSKMTEIGSKALFQAVQAAPLWEGICFSSPES